MTNCDRAYANLSDIELLGKLIGVQQSRRVYKGSLQKLFTTSAGGAAPAKCAVARELILRSMREEMQTGVSLHAPHSVRDYLRLTIGSREYEVFVVVFLDAQNRVIAEEEMFKGTLTQTSVYPREVVKASLRHNAASVIFAHNHPSGIPEPSLADRSLTKNLVLALALVDVRVLDHFIVAGQGTLSFAEHGLL